MGYHQCGSEEEDGPLAAASPAASRQERTKGPRRSRSKGRKDKAPCYEYPIRI